MSRNSEGGLGLFSFDIQSNSYIKLLDCDSNDAKIPVGKLIKHPSNNKLYGLSNTGGAYNKGSLFSLDPETLEFTKLLDFDGSQKGEYPLQGLIIGNDGKLYGLTEGGGIYGTGVMYSYNISTNTYNKEFDFQNFQNTVTGIYPHSCLTMTSNGIFIVTAVASGTENHGVLFSYNPINGDIQTLVNFDGIGKGSDPLSTVIGIDGKIYGVTYSGGDNNYGVFYSYDLSTSTYNKLIDFDFIATGIYPTGELIEAPNGKIYGITYFGGSFVGGVLYSYDIITNTFAKLVEFNPSTDGKVPVSISLGYDGKIYGASIEGGVNDKGVLFSYDINSSTFTNLYDFATSNNDYSPTGVIEISVSDYAFTAESSNNQSEIIISPNPAIDYFNINSSHQILSLDILDENGKVLFSKKIISKSTNISSSDLSPGIYYIKIISNENTSYHKIFKQ